MKRLRITVEGKTYEVEIELLDEDAPDTRPAQRPVAGGSKGRRARTQAPAAEPKPAAPAAGADGNAVTSPLGAVVVSVDVAAGDSVEEGQKVVTLEAMKMNTVVTAHKSGTVETIHVKAGDGVEEGQPLIALS